MSRETESRNSFRKSMGAGFQAMVSPNKRTYYILQHRTASARSFPGQNQEIIVDYALLGKSSKAAIRFGDDLPMVSTEHAAIVKEDGKWVIRHLSKVNETIVNGRPVKERWFLQHGDEIQLANGGPRLGFLIPDNPTVGSIGLTRRLSLFRQQALRPYKTALYVISAIFLLAIGGLAWWNMNLGKKLMLTEVKLSETTQLVETQNDSISALNKKNSEIQASLKKTVENLNTTISGLRKRADAAMKAADAARDAVESGESGNKVSLPGEMEPYIKDVYFLEVTNLTATITDDAGNTTYRNVPDVKWYGTGFLMNDGRFITARHVIQPWYFFKSNEEDASLQLLNILDLNGANLTVDITAKGPNGQVLQFKTNDFSFNTRGDKAYKRTVEGQEYLLKVASNNAYDYAVARATAGGLQANTNFQAKEGMVLYSLSYPGTFGATNLDDIRPHFIKIIVSRSGQEGGYITGTGAGIAPGSSGGPVFIKDTDGVYKVIGIISAITGNNLDFIVPINKALRQ